MVGIGERIVHSEDVWARERSTRAVIVVFVVSLMVGGVVALATESSGRSSTARAVDQSAVSASNPHAVLAEPDTVASAPPTSDPPAAPTSSEPIVADLAGAEPTGTTACVLEASTLGFGDSGADVLCLQGALVDAGLLPSASGEFDAVTADAVRSVQTQRNLFVDGVVGRETALSLGIWPDETARVVRTPPPADGAVDLMGYRLSSVASAGDDAPPLPPDSGSGRRLVYDRAGQRIWAVDEEGRIVRSWLVSGSKYGNETPGVHEVYSRSEMSTAWNGKAFLPKMVRWLKTDIGAIGFHGLPRHVEDNSPYQTEAELGTRLSGGCQRQADLDAAFTWDFAQIGTKVVVV